MCHNLELFAFRFVFNVFFLDGWWRGFGVSNRKSLVTGLVNSCLPLAVFTLTTSVTQSEPLITFVILARGYWPLGFNSSVMMTMSSTASASVSLDHFLRVVSDGTNSLNHGLQKCSTFSWLFWNCFSVVWEMAVLVSFNGDHGLAPA